MKLLKLDMRATILSLFALVAAFALLAVAPFASPQQAPQSAPNGNGQPTPAGAQAPGGAGGPGAGRGFGRQRPVEDFNDNTGWTSMFNGQDLTGWDADKSIWKVKDGAIYAESTCVLPTGTVYIDYTADKNIGDFDMKFETLATDNVNGGLQYRSWIKGTPGKPTRPQRPAGAGNAGRGLGAAANGQAGQGGPPPSAANAQGGPAPGGPGNAQGGAGFGGGRGGARGPALGSPAASAVDRGGRGSGPVVFAPACNGNSGPGPDPAVAVDPYYLDGPQFDYDAKGGVSGNFYEQDGRGTMANEGEVIVAEPDFQPVVISRFADRATAQSWWKQNDWNQMMVTVRGHTYMQFINGHLATVVVDYDPKYFQATGMIGFEIESTGSVAMRNLYIRKY